MRRLMGCASIAAGLTILAGLSMAQAGNDSANEPGAIPGQGMGQGSDAKSQRKNAKPADRARGQSLAHRPIVATQGRKTFQIYPLHAAVQGGKTVTVEEFYKYHRPNAASSNTSPPLEISQKSQLFFYLEKDIGRLSLVIIHDKVRDGSGGEVEFQFAGMPGAARLAVKDDPGEQGLSGTNVQNKILWRWWPCCTDGAVISRLSAGFNFTITPKFKSGIDEWKARSRKRNGQQEFITLDMTQPLRLHLGGPGR